MAEEAGVTKLNRAAGMASSALQSGASIGGAAASAVLGGAVSAASAAGALVQEYGPGIARAAAQNVRDNIAAIPGVLEGGIRVAGTVKDIVDQALAMNTAAAEYQTYSQYPIGFRTRRNTPERQLPDLSPDSLWQIQQDMAGHPDAYGELQPVRRRLEFQPEVGERGQLSMGVPPPPSQTASSSMGVPSQAEQILFDPTADTSSDTAIDMDVEFVIKQIDNQKFEGVLQQDYAINTLIYNLYSIIKREAVSDPRKDMQVKNVLKLISDTYKNTTPETIDEKAHNVIVYYYVLKHLMKTGRIKPETRLYKIEDLLYQKMPLSPQTVGSRGKKEVSSSVASTGVPTTSAAPLTGTGASSSGYDTIGPPIGGLPLGGLPKAKPKGRPKKKQ